MNRNKKFLDRVQNVTDPNIEEGIRSGNPYTICDILEETKGAANGIYLKKLEDAIIATNDIVQIYEFLFLAVDMNVIGFDREKFERIIRETNNPKLMCYCMGFVPRTNIELMLQALVKTRNAKDEEYSDVYEEVKEINPNYEETVEEAKKFDYFPESLKEFIDLRNDIPKLKSEVKATKNAHLITELANYLEYLGEYKDQSYDGDDLAVAQAETEDPMQAYEFLASVNSINIENKTKLIQTVINSGKVKFMYYVYEYVLGLTEEEKNYLKENIKEADKNGKYREMIEDTISEKENYEEGNGIEN